MHALESARVEALFEVLHRFAQDQRIVSSDDAHIVARCLDTLYRVDIDAENLAAILDVDQLLEPTARNLFLRWRQVFGGLRRNFADHIAQPLHFFSGTFVGKALTDALHRIGKPIGFDRLHQIIDSLRLERLDCVLAIGSHKDEQRRIDVHHPLHHRKAVKAGHLDVKEDEVGLQRLDLADRLPSVEAGCDDFDIVKSFQAELEALGCQFLVVDEDCADSHAVTAP